MNRYRAGEPGPEMDSSYEPLLRPDGSMVAFLGEPEDRYWGRDLSKVIDELNRLYSALSEIAHWGVSIPREMTEDQYEKSAAGSMRRFAQNALAAREQDA